MLGNLGIWRGQTGPPRRGTVPQTHFHHVPPLVGGIQGGGIKDQIRPPFSISA